MRTPLLGALALTTAITTQARADYVWEFVPTEVTAVSGFVTGVGDIPVPGVSHKEARSWLPDFALTSQTQDSATGR